MSYTYIYLDPRKPGEYTYEEFKFEYEPFYVGKGTKMRFLAHLEMAKDLTSLRGKHKTAKIRKILDNGLEPVILKLNENVSHQEALVLEARLIKLIGRADKKLGPLVNFTDGGGRKPGNNGLLGFKHSEETKNKIRQTSKGHKRTDNFKKKIGELKKGNTNFLGKKHQPGNMQKREQNKIKKTLSIMKERGLDFSEENYNSSIPYPNTYPKYSKIFNYFSLDEIEYITRKKI